MLNRFDGRGVQKIITKAEVLQAWYVARFSMAATVTTPLEVILLSNKKRCVSWPALLIKLLILMTPSTQQTSVSVKVTSAGLTSVFQAASMKPKLSNVSCQ